MIKTKQCYPSREQYVKLAEESNIVPVYSEIVADLETPVSVYAKVFKNGCSCLLESVEGSTKLSRYSFIAGDPFLVLKAYGEDLEITCDGQTKKEKGDTIAALREILSRYKAAEIPELPRFFGGALGYLGYESLALSKRLPSKLQGEQALPDAFLIFPECVIVFDHYKSRLKIIINTRPAEDSTGSYNKAVERIEEITAAIHRNNCALPPSSAKRYSSEDQISFKSNISRPQFLAMVKNIKNHIKSDEIKQVVLSQKFEVDIDVSKTFEVYRALRSLNPSPYMFYLDFDEVKVAGASPEMLVRLENGMVETRPIAGTRPRGENPESDQALQTELINDAKENAEHDMLVELGRSDLGKVSQEGSVEVPIFKVCEKYSHVMHLVSEVKGKLKENKDALEALVACFPAGTVSGAPRSRAMEIISDLEPDRRGPYAGAVGYISYAGNMDTCITIRTVVFAGGKAYAQAGAGIVAESRPEREYEETLSKARVMLEALRIAEEGLENERY